MPCHWRYAMPAKEGVVTKYSMDPAWEHEKERLDAQASLHDPGTRARIEALGIKERWRCAEIGGGSGTVAKWLSERVGASGSVVATDVDTRFLEALNLPNVEVRNHDIVNETLEPESFDLVHARLLLMHLAEGRDAALAHMVQGLKPGGWLLAEEQDGVTAGQTFPHDDLQERVSTAMRRVAEQTSVDQQCGRKLPMLLERAGLEEVDADGRTALLRQGSEKMKVAALFFSFQRNRIAETGLVSAEEVDSLLERRGTPGPLRMMSPLIVAAWGRKPA